MPKSRLSYIQDWEGGRVGRMLATSKYFGLRVGPPTTTYLLSISDNDIGYYDSAGLWLLDSDHTRGSDGKIVGNKSSFSEDKNMAVFIGHVRSEEVGSEA